MSDPFCKISISQTCELWYEAFNLSSPLFMTHITGLSDSGKQIFMQGILKYYVYLELSSKANHILYIIFLHVTEVYIYFLGWKPTF